MLQNIKQKLLLHQRYLKFWGFILGLQTIHFDYSHLLIRERCDIDRNDRSIDRKINEMLVTR